MMVPCSHLWGGMAPGAATMLSKQRCACFQSCAAPDELLQVEHRPLDPRLRVRVVVLDAVQQLAQAPVAVRLHLPRPTQQLSSGLRLQFHDISISLCGPVVHAPAACRKRACMPIMY